MLPTWPYPFWIAHRGAGRLAPENTLAAFKVGMEHGYGAFECDVQLSLDGVPFLLHDDTLDRTSNGHGLGCQLDWAALSKLDAGAWHSPSFVGEPLASLAGLTALAHDHQLALNLELKPAPGQATTVGAGVAQWLHQHWRAPVPPLLSSFEPEALRAARSAGYPIALLRERWGADALPLAQQLGAVAVVCHHATLTAAAIKTLHAAGLKALSYTVNTREEAQRLIAAGVDGLITDAIDSFRP